MPNLTQERLKELLNYDPDTGVFTWLKSYERVKRGDIAGSYDTKKYRVIKINGKKYLSHRLAWLYVYGYFPENGIDHIDRTPFHNWISNLREVSMSCNRRNTGNSTTNTSGVKGVYWFRPTKKWAANIKVNGNSFFLGYYKSFDNAVCARLAGEQCLDWSNCDSNSPSYKYVLKILQDAENGN